ncbi:hypothetical protein M3J09_002237 [Ascochyta lentis]
MHHVCNIQDFDLLGVKTEYGVLRTLSPDQPPTAANVEPALRSALRISHAAASPMNSLKFATFSLRMTTLRHREALRHHSKKQYSAAKRRCSPTNRCRHRG